METIEKVKLSEVISLSDIHSVVIISIHGKRSMVISLKNGLTAHGFYDGVAYIPLNKFSYSLPSGVAMPSEYYKYITLSIVRDEFGAETTFARITRHIPFGQRREAVWRINHSSWDDVQI